MPKFKVGDAVRLSRSSTIQYPTHAKLLGTGAVREVQLLLYPNYYGYRVEFASSKKLLLLGDDALAKIPKGARGKGEDSTENILAKE